MRGEQTAFTASLERAVEEMPGNPLLWQTYLDLLTHAEMHSEVVAVASRARAKAGARRSFDAAEAIARAELDDLEQAEALFCRLGPLREAALIAHYMRFLLRSGRFREAAALGERTAPTDRSHEIWPYLSLAWRVLNDPRWEWLEGDPRFIGVYDVPERLPNLKALAGRLRSLHRAGGEPLGQSVRGGTQTEGHLFDRIDPELVVLREALVEIVRDHVAQLPAPQASHPLLVSRRGPIRFAGSWSVRLTNGGRHSQHVHPAGWLSSALYVSLPETVTRGEGHDGWLSLGEMRALGLDLPAIRLVEPKRGRLVLFPSTMWHGTRPFGTGERLSVAFDVARTQ